MRPIVVQTPQVTLDTYALENTFDSVGQSMLQLARAQDQTNRQLQQTHSTRADQYGISYWSLTATCHLYLSKKF